MVARPIACPCCSQPVVMPTLEIINDLYKLSPMEVSILGAIWCGKGHPVRTARIFEAMYSDDLNGVPEPILAYSAFKVALCHMRRKLKGSSVSIKNVGYARGYRIAIGEG